MESLKPISSVSNDLIHNELYFSISGLWDLAGMQAFIVELNKGAYPLTKEGRPIHVMGAMDGFVAQSRETGDAIRDHLIASRQYGLSRVALHGASALVKLQYKRLSDGLEVDFFDGKIDAMRWLRRPYQNAA